MLLLNNYLLLFLHLLILFFSRIRHCNSAATIDKVVRISIIKLGLFSVIVNAAFGRVARLRYFTERISHLDLFLLENHDGLV